MVKLFKATFTWRELFLCSLVLLITPCITGIGASSFITLVFGHYIPTVLNVGFMVLSYRKYAMINDAYTNIAIRYKGYKVLLCAIGFALCYVAVYTILLNGYIILVNGMVEAMHVKEFIRFTCFNVLQLLIGQAFLVLQIGNRKSFLYIAVPVMLNFIFHYWFVPLAIKM